VSALQNDFPEAAEFLVDFQQMSQSLTVQDVEDWLESDHNDLGYEHDGIVNHIAGELSGEQDSSDESDDGGPSEIPTEESIHVISHQETIDMFDKCLTWLQCKQHQCASITKRNCKVISIEAAYTSYFYREPMNSSSVTRTVHVPLCIVFTYTGIYQSQVILLHLHHFVSSFLFSPYILSLHSVCTWFVL